MKIIWSKISHSIHPSSTTSTTSTTVTSVVYHALRHHPTLFSQEGVGIEGEEGGANHTPTTATTSLVRSMMSLFFTTTSHSGVGGGDPTTPTTSNPGASDTSSGEELNNNNDNDNDGEHDKAILGVIIVCACVIGLVIFRCFCGKLCAWYYNPVVIVSMDVEPPVVDVELVLSGGEGEEVMEVGVAGLPQGEEKEEEEEKLGGEEAISTSSIVPHVVVSGSGGGGGGSGEKELRVVEAVVVNRQHLPIAFLKGEVRGAIYSQA
eukprot:scaffold1945_cov181-Ochromonas_danica.AAC.20